MQTAEEFAMTIADKYCKACTLTKPIHCFYKKAHTFSAICKSCRCHSDRLGRQLRAAAGVPPKPRIQPKKASERGIWSGIKQRCHSVSDKSYPRYGGRGI